MKETKGITLIALVITIIVLLILAGVAISMLSGENGILNQAAEAKTKTETQSTIEQIRLGAMEAMTNTSHRIQSKGDLETALKNQGLNNANVTEIEGGFKVTANGVTQIITNSGNVREESGVEKNIGKEITGSKATLLDENGEQIVVPVGFKIKEDSPTTVKRGIVVAAHDNSEFVWVPVADITKMATETSGTDENGNKNYQGKLYDFKSENGVYSATEKTSYGQGTTSYREPSLVTGNSKDTYAVLETVTGTSYDNGTDTTVTPNKKYYEYAGYSSAKEFGKAMQEDYNEMVKSVQENKGFYVGRYETSLNESGYAQSIAGIKSATAYTDSANTWYGLYQKEKEYSSKNSLTEVVGSSMIWGSQYDQMMIWMQSNGIDVKSTTPTNLEGITTSKNTTRVTGSKAEDKLNNIYDLLGSCWEWTLEADRTWIRMRRGSRWDMQGGCASDRPSGDYNPNFVTYGISSRLALYVQ